MLDELKGGDDEGRFAFPHLVHDDVATSDRLSKVGANREINVEHHDIFGLSKQSRDVAPTVELTVERVDDQVNVHIGRHVGRGNVEVVQFI